MVSCKKKEFELSGYLKIVQVSREYKLSKFEVLELYCSSLFFVFSEEPSR